MDAGIAGNTSATKLGPGAITGAAVTTGAAGVVGPGTGAGVGAGAGGVWAAAKLSGRANRAASNDFTKHLVSDVCSIRSVCDSQKVLQHPLPVLGPDGFGMELHAVDGKLAVLHTHDLVLAWPVLAPRRDHQLFRQGVALRHQRVISHGRKRQRHPFEQLILL